MLRPIALLVFCLAVMIFSACSSTGPNEGIEVALSSDMLEEPPLTQDDIDAYVDMAPSIAPFWATDGQDAAQIYSRYGMSRNRFNFFREKMRIYFLLKRGSSVDKNEVPYNLMPSEDELNLLDRNWADIRESSTMFKEIAKSKF